MLAYSLMACVDALNVSGSMLRKSQNRRLRGQRFCFDR
jgi:hypothetical protein